MINLKRIFVFNKTDTYDCVDYCFISNKTTLSHYHFGTDFFNYLAVYYVTIRIKKELIHQKRSYFLFTIIKNVCVGYIKLNKRNTPKSRSVFFFKSIDEFYVKLDA